jgi:hypothetical protein
LFATKLQKFPQFLLEGMNPYFEDYLYGSSDYPRYSSDRDAGVPGQTSVFSKAEEINSMRVLDVHRRVNPAATNQARFRAILRRIRPEIRVQRRKLYRAIALDDSGLAVVRLLPEPAGEFPAQHHLELAAKSGAEAEVLAGRLIRMPFRR